MKRIELMAAVKALDYTLWQSLQPATSDAPEEIDATVERAMEAAREARLEPDLVVMVDPQSRDQITGLHVFDRSLLGEGNPFVEDHCGKFDNAAAIADAAVALAKAKGLDEIVVRRCLSARVHKAIEARMPGASLLAGSLKRGG